MRGKGKGGGGEWKGMKGRAGRVGGTSEKLWELNIKLSYIHSDNLAGPRVSIGGGRAETNTEVAPLANPGRGKHHRKTRSADIWV